jgi:hypothetical protein
LDFNLKFSWVSASEKNGMPNVCPMAKNASKVCDKWQIKNSSMLIYVKFGMPFYLMLTNYVPNGMLEIFICHLLHTFDAFFYQWA